MDKQLKLTSNGNTCNRGGQLRNFEILGQLKVKCSYDVPVSIPVARKNSQLEAKTMVGLLDNHKHNFCLM